MESSTRYAIHYSFSLLLGVGVGAVRGLGGGEGGSSARIVQQNVCNEHQPFEKGSHPCMASPLALAVNCFLKAR